ncbi:hypothetical protein HYW82_04200, partial [Candidatus Peregrinibacteria bacterium]|nr:hypothetical protein [Candidatus Peregrinibacteria bacterium]
KDDLRVVIEDIFDQIATTKVAEDNNLKIVIGLAWLTSKSDLIVDKVSVFMSEKLPECARGAGLSEDLSCIPSGISRDDFKVRLNVMLRSDLMAKLPQEFAFDLKTPDKLAGHTMSEFVGGAAKIFFVAVCSVLILLLVIIGLVVFRPLFLVIQWVSKTVAIAAFAASVLFGVVVLAENSLMRASGIFRLAVLFVESIAAKLILPDLLVFLFSAVIWIFSLYKLKKVNVK